MMKKFDFNEILLKIIVGKTGRFNYLLSVLIIVVGVYYFFEHYDPNTCHVCFPIMKFPWGELVGLLVMMALGGFYSCFLFCMLATDERYCYGPIIIPILFTLFYVIQTMKRCHDVDCSGWRFLIPVYSSLLLLFLPGVREEENPVKTSILMTICKSKWFILTLILMIAYIYYVNFENICIHNAL